MSWFWVLYLLGVAAAFGAAWWLRGLTDTDWAEIAELDGDRARGPAPGQPKDYPYP